MGNELWENKWEIIQRRRPQLFCSTHLCKPWLFIVPGGLGNSFCSMHIIVGTSNLAAAVFFLFVLLNLVRRLWFG